MSGAAHCSLMPFRQFVRFSVSRSVQFLRTPELAQSAKRRTGHSSEGSPVRRIKC